MVVKEIKVGLKGLALIESLDITATGGGSV